MADYNAKAASNTFVVTNEDAFAAAMAEVGLVSGRAPSGEPGRVYVYSNCDHGTWPAERFDAEAGEYVALDIPALIAPYLADGQIAVLKEAGSEKARYVGGTAVAFNAAADTVTVDLDEIYDRARHLGTELAQDV